MSARRLPGVYFETAAPPIPEVLPRMDIAAFVGFAASGPLDVPVAVEDSARFVEIFGQDQPLAWDTSRGEMAYAQLPPAVRGYFRNGGQRCWVVRVADNATAQSNEFMLSGLLQTSGDSAGYEGSWAQARSEGSWSDDLMVNTTMTFTPLPVVATQVFTTQVPDPGYTLALQPGLLAPVGAGDTLQLVFAGAQATPPAPSDAVAYLPLTNISFQAFSPGPNLRPVQQAVLGGKQAFWFRPAVPADFPALQSSPPAAADSFGVVRLPMPGTATWLTRPDNVPLTVFGWGASPAQNQFVVETLREVTDAIQPGSWLQLQFSAPFLPAGATSLFLLVEDIRGVSSESAAASPSSPVLNQERALIVAGGAWWALDEGTSRSSYKSSHPEITALGLELWVRDGQGTVSQLSDLGLAPPQPRYLGYLPTDTQLFQQSDRPGVPPGVVLMTEASQPRFALAAPNGGSPVIYVPLGVPGFPKNEFYQSAIPVTRSALERDGLAPAATGACSSFSSALFLDPELANSNASTLLTEAFHKQYQLRRANDTGPAGEPLQKMHAVIPIQEVSLLSVPDAIHPGWTDAGSQVQEGLSAPSLIAISRPDSQGRITLFWSKVDNAYSYTLQQSTDPQFAGANIVWEGSGQQSDPLPQTGTCPVRSYFRVRANGRDGISPWSNTLADEFPPEAFELCVPDFLDAPVLNELGDNRGQITLGWSASAAGITSFRLEVAVEPAFEFPQLIYQGTQTSFAIWKSPGRTSYFRISAQRGIEQSPFSNPVVVPAENGGRQWQMTPVGDNAGIGPCEDELLAIHQAMLRLCAARADIFAVLSLPRNYHTQPALDYKNRLMAALMPEETERTLSFGALYHPWPVVRDSADNSALAVRAETPDGTVCGSIAQLTINSGAWYAAANLVLTGVVDLEPHLEEEAAQEFFDGQINLVAQESRGFVCTSSYTLSSETEVREINVRRLLILIRRLALRDGADFVFLPNDIALRNSVRRQFNQTLSNMFVRGAFTGSTQDEAFQVVTDSSVNTPEMIDQGRFIVELRVAPSLPLEFLTVRLVQTGGEVLLSEEF
jgi:hypothetical protein